MQTALLSAGIAIILALVTALVGPFFVDWGSYRAEFETRVAHLTGLEVRVSGAIDVRIHGDRADAHFAQGADDTNGDLATIGDEDFAHGD